VGGTRGLLHEGLYGGFLLRGGLMKAQICLAHRMAGCAPTQEEPQTGLLQCSKCMVQHQWGTRAISAPFNAHPNLT
jgi:hypothetical protein